MDDDRSAETAAPPALFSDVADAADRPEAASIDRPLNPSGIRTPERPTIALMRSTRGGVADRARCVSPAAVPLGPALLAARTTNTAAPKSGQT